MRNLGIAFFDFDGTITEKDTMFEFVKFSKGYKRFLIGLCILSPILFIHKMNLLSSKSAKEFLLKYFFKNSSYEIMVRKGQDFCREKIISLVRPSAIERINLHLSLNHEVVIVSASCDLWLKEWCDMNGIYLIATELEVIEGLITGKIKGENCNGIEKANRIRRFYDLSKYSVIFGYGDTEGDKEMLALASEQYFRYFK